MLLKRLRLAQLAITISSALIISRLFYWQIIRGFELSGKANSQYQSTATLTAKRGSILASDQGLLAGIEDTYQLFVYKPKLKRDSASVINDILPVIISSPQIATDPSRVIPQTDYENQIKTHLFERMNLDKTWIALQNHLSRSQKDAIEKLGIEGLGFQEQPIRFYPEASMSAHVLGFVGNDINGHPQGYFGLEGYYERQLEGRSGLLKQENDALGNPILIGQFANYQSQDGRNLLTTINRSLQYQTERLLAEGLAKYGASEGSVIILETKTGAVLSMANLPRYDPRFFYLFPTNSYRNPSVANLFEPGSVFKPLVMAAAIDAGSIGPDTKCDSTCDRQIQIGSFTIKTWNDQYYPGTTMTETIIHSDNTGMVFAARKLGSDNFREYLDKFGFGHSTNIDLQEEVPGSLRPAKDWKEADLATISFGQGIAVTPIQLVTAINAIANKGKIVSPYLVQAIQEGSIFIPIKRPADKQIISLETSQKVTDMMIAAVNDGEAKWAKPKNITIAGKTGTAQIPIKGHYDEEKTIASFVGFAPASNPKFTMLVTLREPQSSPWGSETAAPLWFEIAKQFLLLEN